MDKQITKKDKNKALILTFLVLLIIGIMMLGIIYRPDLMRLLFGWFCIIVVFIIAGVSTYHIILGKDLDDY